MKVRTPLVVMLALASLGCVERPRYTPLTAAYRPGFAKFGYAVDGNARAVYVLEGTQGPDLSRCSEECMKYWQPVPAGILLAAQYIDPAKMGTVASAKGPQMTYFGWPLYYYYQDKPLTDPRGHRLSDKWGTWSLICQSGVPIKSPPGTQVDTDCPVYD